MAKGAYLVIEHTEALHVIDVNSEIVPVNKKIKKIQLLCQFNFGLEIARQLCYMGGIIVVDFIDMGNSQNRAALYNHLREEMKDDKAKHKILPPSKFGLVQITRQRVRPERNIKTKEQNPSESSSGEVEAPMFWYKITNELERLINKCHKKIEKYTPFYCCFLTQGFLSIRSKWFFEHKNG